MNVTFVYWIIGVIWIFDGFFCFIFPRWTRLFLSKTIRQRHYFMIGIGPTLVSIGLLYLSFFSPDPWILRILGGVSIAEAIFLSVVSWARINPIRQWLFNLSFVYYRFLGIIFTILGPFLISLRP